MQKGQAKGGRRAAHHGRLPGVLVPGGLPVIHPRAAPVTLTPLGIPRARARAPRRRLHKPDVGEHGGELAAHVRQHLQRGAAQHVLARERRAALPPALHSQTKPHGLLWGAWRRAEGRVRRLVQSEGPTHCSPERMTCQSGRRCLYTGFTLCQPGVAPAMHRTSAMWSLRRCMVSQVRVGGTWLRAASQPS